MDFGKLIIRNFGTIGEAIIDLSQRGLLLIQGENVSDTSAKSNGAGKSTLVDALDWVLFGVTARGLTGDGVVNRTAKKDTEVTLEINDDGTRYRVSRYRKHKIHKNQLFVTKITGTGEVDLSKGTDKETQDIVAKILGCSLDVFNGAIYAGQEKMPDMPNMTDKQLKLLIEEAAGVEELAEAYQEASRLALGAEKEFDAARNRLAMNNASLAAKTAELATAEAEHAAFEAGRKGRARDELAKATPVQNKIAEIDAAIARFNEADMNSRKAVLEAELSSHGAQTRQLEALEQKHRDASDKKARFESTLEVMKSGFTKAQENLKDVEKRVGTPCGECGKSYCAHDLDTVRDLRTRGVQAAKEWLLNSAKGTKAALAEQATAQSAVSTFKAGMTDVSGATAELTRINSLTGQLAGLRLGRAQQEASLAKFKEVARQRLIELNPQDGVIAAKKAEISAATAAVATATTEAAEAEQKATLFGDAAKVFGPAGVRAHILDTVTPFLNERTAEYLGTLSDGNIHATWSTLSKTAKGDLKEKFNIEVTNDQGGESFAAISGGEKRKVRIATNLALQDMVASRAEKPINLWIGDEIDQALDEFGLERLMTVLDSKAKERGTVLVISHLSLGDWIDNVITVRKDGGVSTVSGATVPTF